MNGIHEYLARSRDAFQAAIDDPRFAITIREIAEAIANALSSGGKLLLAGNGGSAADAQHIAGEIVSRMNYDRAPAAALALTTDSSVITARSATTMATTGCSNVRSSDSAAAAMYLSGSQLRGAPQTS